MANNIFFNKVRSTLISIILLLLLSCKKERISEIKKGIRYLEIQDINNQNYREKKIKRSRKLIKNKINSINNKSIAIDKSKNKIVYISVLGLVALGSSIFGYVFYLESKTNFLYFDIKGCEKYKNYYSNCHVQNFSETFCCQNNFPTEGSCLEWQADKICSPWNLNSLNNENSPNNFKFLRNIYCRVSPQNCIFNGHDILISNITVHNITDCMLFANKKCKFVFENAICTITANRYLISPNTTECEYFHKNSTCQTIYGDCHKDQEVYNKKQFLDNLFCATALFLFASIMLCIGLIC